MTDVKIHFLETVCTIEPLTKDARLWSERFIGKTFHPRWANATIPIDLHDRSVIQDIIRKMIGSGLVVECVLVINRVDIKINGATVTFVDRVEGRSHHVSLAVLEKFVHEFQGGKLH